MPQRNDREPPAHGAPMLFDMRDLALPALPGLWHLSEPGATPVQASEPGPERTGLPLIGPSKGAQLRSRVAEAEPELRGGDRQGQHGPRCGCALCELVRTAEERKD